MYVILEQSTALNLIKTKIAKFELFMFVFSDYLIITSLFSFLINNSKTIEGLKVFDYKEKMTFHKLII